jgi:hypothetical protein
MRCPLRHAAMGNHGNLLIRGANPTTAAFTTTTQAQCLYEIEENVFFVLFCSIALAKDRLFWYKFLFQFTVYGKL